MVRISTIAFLSLACAPAALFAAPAELGAKISAVTLFPWGAQVQRAVTVPAGTSGEVLIPNLPAGTDIAALRVAGEGLEIGAVRLIDGRDPALEKQADPAIAAARAEVERLTAALAEKQDGVAAIRAKVAAAEARIAFLRGLDTQNVTPDQIAKLAATVGDGVFAADQARIAAEAEARAADLALKPDREALERAQKALAALEHPEAAGETLSVMVSGPGTVTVTTYVDDAGWAPSYDLRLASDGDSLGVDRYVSVHQATGEDWSGVDLTLSTARPSERSDPSALWPDLRRIGPPEPPVVRMAAPKRAMAVGEDMVEPAIEAAPAIAGMDMQMQGETVTYHYPAAVDIRDGVEDLRLKLDHLDRKVTQLAEAVPMGDETAYRVVEGRNDGAEPLLPGPAVLWLDGAVVGGTDLPLVAAGDKLRLGFGAIDGLKLKRVIPEANEGDRGIISKSNERREVAEITVENLTARDWPLRVIDRVPYSEQEDLKISYKATPAETESDYDDQRGLLMWALDLGAGKTQVIRLETTLSWPADQVLQ